MGNDALIRVTDSYSDQQWRLHNLYWIVNKAGVEQRFVPNWAQVALMKDMHLLELVLKARQLGITTFIDILLLDNCVFNANTKCGIIAHTRDDAKTIFKDKVKFPFDKLPDQIKLAVEPNTDSSNEIVFANNSSIRVGTSMRSGTLQYLHISEYGKLCAKYPEKAREIKTGALNTVEVGQVILIESTAEGRSGHFFDLCKEAGDRQRLGRLPTSLEFNLTFFPWWKHPHYTMGATDIERTIIGQEMLDYFAALNVTIRKELPGGLTDGQKSWYTMKAKQQGPDMKREYPSTPEEAFEASVEGAYYSKQMAKVRNDKRICKVPHTKGILVNTFWDLGWRDSMVIWFHQRVGLEDRFIDYMEDTGEDYDYYAKEMQLKPYLYGKHYAPHDAEKHSLQTGKTDAMVMEEVGIRPLEVVQRIESDAIGRGAVRSALDSCYFDEVKCEQGIACLDHFRKDWDDKLGTYKSTYRHDWASHGAKAFEQFAIGYSPIVKKKGRRKTPRNWRTA